eukprot:11900086-Alexandrium_andersonii.AAC.1
MESAGRGRASERCAGAAGCSGRFPAASRTPAAGNRDRAASGPRTGGQSSAPRAPWASLSSPPGMR